MDIEELAADLDRSFASTGTGGLFRPLLVLLARGEPVSVGDLTAATGLSATEVDAMLADLPDLETDEQGRVVGSGLTQRATPHRFTVAGRQLYTWCALDTLIFPAVVGQAATVESPCHSTGAPIRLTVDPEAGVTSMEPATTVVSIVTPDQQGTIRTAFCNQVHFFVSPTAAQPWIDQHPGMTVLPVADAHRLGRSLIAALVKNPTTQPGRC
jgi:alkylmercury lyase